MLFTLVAGCVGKNVSADIIFEELVVLCDDGTISFSHNAGVKCFELLSL